MSWAQTLIGPDIELRHGALTVASARVLSDGSGTLHIEYSPGVRWPGSRAAGLSSTPLLSGCVGAYSDTAFYAGLSMLFRASRVPGRRGDPNSAQERP